MEQSERTPEAIDTDLAVLHGKITAKVHELDRLNGQIKDKTENRARLSAYTLTDLKAMAGYVEDEISRLQAEAWHAQQAEALEE